jgi:hypothetical protein
LLKKIKGALVDSQGPIIKKGQSSHEAVFKRGKSEREQLKDAIARSGYVAIWAIGPREGWPITIGMSTDPDTMLKNGQRWFWGDLDIHFVVWAGSLSEATTVKKRLEEILGVNHIRGSWYDIRQEMIKGMLDVAAAGAKIEIFTEEERSRRLAAANDRSIGKLGSKRK